MASGSRHFASPEICRNAQHLASECSYHGPVRLATEDEPQELIDPCPVGGRMNDRLRRHLVARPSPGEGRQSTRPSHSHSTVKPTAVDPLPPLRERPGRRVITLTRFVVRLR